MTILTRFRHSGTVLMAILLTKRVRMSRFLLVCLLGSIMLAATSQTDILNQALTIQYIQKLKQDYKYLDSDPLILISAKTQKLYLVQNQKVQKTYSISTSAKGIGAKAGSDQTPPGIHVIDQKFGAGAPLGTIFQGRVNQGKVAEIITEPKDVPEDYVTSRILWLKGLEPGINSGPGVDSKKRYIYIHGTQEEGLIGQPASHGCIRMYNRDVIELFDLVDTGCFVVILNDL